MNLPKLIIQIPCYNEAATIGVALDAIPRSIPGFGSVEILVIDDGSTDGTAEVARAHGASHVVSLPYNQGLARGFIAGIEAALHAGADVIVNTDADNQYDAADIPALTRPILDANADMVIGTRPIHDIEHFSPIKKRLQHLGSAMVRIASGTDVDDAPSGFRAFSRDAAMRLFVLNDYTYTLETIIHAGHQRMSVVTVPIHVNEDLRPSRLVKSIASYVKRSAFTIVRYWLSYRAPRIFAMASASCALLAFLFFVGAIVGNGNRAWMLFAGLSAIAAVSAVIADLQIMNRKLLQQIRYRLIKQEMNAKE